MVAFGRICIPCCIPIEMDMYSMSLTFLAECSVDFNLVNVELHVFKGD